jgi:diguanylate cyclase
VNAPPASGRLAHWMVQANHRVRSGVFGLVFLVIGVHQAGQGWPAAAWALLALQFLVYPHVVYAAGLSARDPMRTETLALVLDPFLMGLWLAYLGFPLWISYSVAIGTMISIGVYRAVRGLAAAAAALVAGAGTMVALRGWHFAPQTDWPATLLSIATLTAYLLLVALSAHRRALKLHAVRLELQENKRSLQRQLDEIHALQAQLSEAANRDALTGLHNRRYLESTMEREIERCRRDGAPLALVLVDVDHFKRINDSFGHPAGDAVLVHVAALLQAGARAGDVVCRYGGEEFLLVMPGMDLATATGRAHDFRAALASGPVRFDCHEIHATLSIGTASFPEHGTTPRELVGCVDAALYRAKKEGRNLVVAAGAG